MKKNTPHIEVQYNLLVQVDYLAGLYTAFLLGAEKWVLFFIALGVSLALGFWTVRLYCKMIKSIVKE